MTDLEFEFLFEALIRRLSQVLFDYHHNAGKFSSGLGMDIKKAPDDREP